MAKEFITCDMIRDAALKLVWKMYKEDGFVPDIIYDSLRGGAYMANVMSEFYKLLAMKEGKNPVFYAAVVARSYGDVKEHSDHVDIDGWTWSPWKLKKGQKVLIVDDIFDTGMTVNALVHTVMEAGIPREDIKVAVYDYKVCLYKDSQLPVQPDYYCRKHVLTKPEDSRWIHYTCHEFIGLDHDEIDEVFTDNEVREILHTILE
ncbi:MAG: phosphoribosyltransferase [Sphaerochaetaceae bacterium]|nr:phosphoribosyltransferase [Sphaerochaetaceae bacterium]